MADLTIRAMAQGFLFAVFGFSMVIAFSGSIFNVYDADVDSSTLKSIKNSTQSSQIDPGTYRNRTQSIDVESSGFLSPSGFGRVKQTLNSISQVPNILSKAASELGLPIQIALLIGGIIVLAAAFQALSSLLGYNV